MDGPGTSDLLTEAALLAVMIGLPFALAWSSLRSREERAKTLAEAKENPLGAAIALLLLACWMVWPAGFLVGWRYSWIPFAAFLVLGLVAIPLLDRRRRR